MANWTWQPSARGPQFEQHLTAVLAKWDRTPYLPGQCCPGAGVDCVRFVCAVWDELLGRPVVPDQAMPQDAAWHDRDGAFRTMLRIRRRFRCRPVRDGHLEPGDVVVVGPEGRHAGPGHVLIVGPRQNTIWHASKPNVHMTGLGYKMTTSRVYRVYRPQGEIHG